MSCTSYFRLFKLYYKLSVSIRIFGFIVCSQNTQIVNAIASLPTSSYKFGILTDLFHLYLDSLFHQRCYLYSFSVVYTGMSEEKESELLAFYLKNNLLEALSVITTNEKDDDIMV